MELQLYRSQFKEGSNGALFFNGKFVCFMIELPWKDNTKNVSCIPDGCYELKLSYTQHFKYHFLVKDVPDRKLILIHPANDALKELEGCLAPVMNLSGIGKGNYSRNTLDNLVLYWERAQQLKEGLYLKISSHDFTNSD